LGLTRGKTLFLAVLMAVAAYATWPGQDTLDYSSCEPKSGLATLSAKLYGRFFWEQALTRASDLATGTERLDANLARMLATAKTRKEGLSTPERLREQADQIEAQETFDQLSSTNRRIVANARHCEQVIMGRLRTM
jgi:hypothetical protein